MIHLQDCKFVSAVAPVSASAGFTCLVVDTLGFDYCTIVVHFGLVGAADYTVLKITEDDAKNNATTLTSPSDVTGLVVGTSLDTAGAATTFPGDTADGTLISFDIDLKARKRYLLLAATAGAASLMSALAILSRAEQAPTTATQRGVSKQLRA